MENNSEVEVNLEKQEIVTQEKKYNFEINSSLKQKFIE
jgi:3-isopropylmalate dehydratase small subunit